MNGRGKREGLNRSHKCQVKTANGFGTFLSGKSRLRTKGEEEGEGGTTSFTRKPGVILILGT